MDTEASLAQAEADLLTKLRGAEDTSVRHEVKSYTWYDKHECSATQTDRTFQTKRHALLYVAKRNSEELVQYIEQTGKKWENMFRRTGAYALYPNAPFELEEFCELSDDTLEEYGNTVCNAFAQHKAKRGTTFRYAPSDSHLCTEETLLKILQRDKPSKEDQDHHKRQALLLSDIAGFD